MSCWLQDPVTSSAGEKLKPLSTVWVMDQISSLSMLIRYLQRCYPIFLLPKFLVSSPFAYGEQSQGIDPPATPHNRRDFFWRPLKKKKAVKGRLAERWMGETLQLIVKLQGEGWALQTALCWVIGVTAGKSARPDLNPHWLNHLYLEW